MKKHSRSSSGFGSITNSKVKAYKFNKTMMMSKSNRSELVARKEQDYKYNLFSILDDAGNNGCKPSTAPVGCWANN